MPIACAAAGGERRRTMLLDGDQARQQAAVAELGLAALSGAPLQPLLDYASVLVARTLAVELCGIVELEGDEDNLVLRAGVGWRDGLVGTARVGRGRESPAGLAVARRDAVVVRNLHAETRFRTPVLLIEHDVHSGASVVIPGHHGALGTQPWGALGAHSRIQRAFTDTDLNFLHAVAHTLALAIERDDAEQDALAAEDRAHERIAQLLHDEILQSLLAARQDLAEAHRGGGASDEAVGRARQAVVAAIGELRNAVVALHPVTLERRGLSPAIEAAACLHAAGAGFELSLDIAPEPAGERDQLVASVARELLSNVARHARAKHVNVGLRRTGGDLVLEVVDDGRGIDSVRWARAVEHGHVGLASIARRVESLGGHFELVRNDGGGTRARVVLPAGSG